MGKLPTASNAFSLDRTYQQKVEILSHDWKSRFCVDLAYAVEIISRNMKIIRWLSP